MSETLMKKVLKAHSFESEIKDLGILNLSDADGDIVVNYELFFKLAKGKAIGMKSGYLCIEAEHKGLIVNIITLPECDILDFLSDNNIKFILK